MTTYAPRAATNDMSVISEVNESFEDRSEFMGSMRSEFMGSARTNNMDRNVENG